MRVAERERRLGAVQRVGRRLDVDPESATTAQPVERDDAAQLREERREAAVAAVRPQRLDHLVARERPQPVQRQVAEQQPALAAGKLALDAPASELDGEAAAELDFRVPSNSAPT